MSTIKNVDTHFVMSYELLTLLQWLVDFEQDALKQMIERSLQHGLQHHLQNAPTAQEKKRAANDLQESIVDLFSVLEAMLYESMKEDESQRVLQSHMMPALKYIDTSACDASVVNMSVAKASAASKNGAMDAKEALCKELLKRWKPGKKGLSH